MKQPHPYHHGNLKEALLEAALQHIDTAGPQGITLREVARRAGVSHNAPYRHFADKDELLAAVAAQGFERLTAAMNAEAAAAGTAADRLRLTGRGYVGFALEYRKHFSVMFDRPPSAHSYAEYSAAARRAFEVLMDAIKACQDAGDLPAGDPTPFAFTAWSLVHGIAKLAIAGQFPFRTTADVLGFTDRATRGLLEGILKKPASPRRRRLKR